MGQTWGVPLYIQKWIVYIVKIWLVVWNIFFPYIGNVIVPTDELHHFSEG